MKLKLLFFNATVLIFLACNGCMPDSADLKVEGPQINQKALTKDSQAKDVGDGDRWIPPEIAQCISNARFGEILAPALDFNPYYLRVNFDSNEAIDFAILVKGTQSQKTGLLICKDAKDVVVFGSISNAKPAVSTFEGDNFVSDSWSINSKLETRNAALDEFGRSRIGSKAKGESVGFYYDGGSLVIFWDGKSFELAEGG